MNFRYFLLILLSTFFLYVLWLPRQTLIRKAFVLCFVAGMLVFALNPDLSTEIANYFGIVRGVDFLFYLSHLTLFFIAFVYYLRFREMEIRFTRLARQVAIDQATNLELRSPD
ncbi:MAG TPA: DUF2304 domain-containing protein [Candidatus Binatia bacterium]|nr:DUF2304 domain-containing protein [Candidatus Binatia bacterium]